MGEFQVGYCSLPLKKKSADFAEPGNLKVQKAPGTFLWESDVDSRCLAPLLKVIYLLQLNTWVISPKQLPVAIWASYLILLLTQPEQGQWTGQFHFLDVLKKCNFVAFLIHPSIHPAVTAPNTALLSLSAPFKVMSPLPPVFLFGAQHCRSTGSFFPHISWLALVTAFCKMPF